MIGLNGRTSNKTSRVDYDNVITLLLILITFFHYVSYNHVDITQRLEY